MLVISIILYTRGGAILYNFSLEGKAINSLSTTQYTVSPHTEVIFPPKGKSIGIFWHSQCAPCKVEMIRLKRSVESNSMDSLKIFAINPFESDQEIEKFIHKNQYPFQFIKDTGISKSLNIEVTPTTVFIESNELKSIHSGMSFLGIWLAESFLK